jgi:hypothetical protein
MGSPSVMGLRTCWEKGSGKKLPPFCAPWEALGFLMAGAVVCPMCFETLLLIGSAVSIGFLHTHPPARADSTAHTHEEGNQVPVDTIQVLKP